MSIIHVAPVDQEAPQPGNEDCPHDPKDWERGYGFAGGGLGAYWWCPHCDKVVSKTQDLGNDA